MLYKKPKMSKKQALRMLKSRSRKPCGRCGRGKRVAGTPPKVGMPTRAR